MDVKEKAVKEPATEGAAPAAVEPVKKVASPEVKVEQPEGEKTPEKVVEVEDKSAKMQAQIDNLNAALRQERDGKKIDAEKIAALENEIAASKDTLGKLKGVFNPEQPEHEKPKTYLTEEQLEAFYAKKREEETQEQKKQAQIDLLQSEISSLEAEWDGTDGKPKYDDDEVVMWQKANGKLNLSPRAAFLEKNHDEIIDYEVNKRMNKKPEVKSVQTPGGSTVEPQKEKKLMSDLETRNAAYEAIVNASAEI